MNNPLTPDEVQKTVGVINNFLNQFFDGYSIVGFHAGSGEAMRFCSADDPKTAHALLSLLAAAASSPIHIPLPPQDGKIDG